MSDLENLFQMGEKSGLSGETLLSFIREREEAERKERAYEREERNREREFKKLEMEREIEMERLRSGSQRGDSRTTSESGTKAKLPKLPNFDDKRDSMDAYLKRFERFAESAGWKKECWGANLSALLQGRALDVYSRLTVAEANDYQKLKDALLKRFNLNEDGFREKFRSSKCESGETASQFVIRLGDYLTNWMCQAGSDETYEGLRDLILREQYLNGCSKGLQVFLKERKFASVTEMADCADRYIEAHEGNGKTGNETRDGVKGKACFVCNGPHLRRDCPRINGRNTMGTNNHRGGNLSGQYSGNGFKSWEPARGGRRPEDKYDRKVSKSSLSACGLSQGKVSLSCGHKLPVMSAACDGPIRENMPECIGWVNGKQIRVLRDTGCSSVVVKRSLVPNHSFTGKVQNCVLLDGTVRQFPTAKVFVETPYFTGKVIAMCVESPVYDLILGNIDGIRNIAIGEYATISEEKKVDETVNEQAAVVTRAQASKEKVSKIKPLKVPTQIKGMNPQMFQEAQKSDPTLQAAREQAMSEEVKQCGKLNTSRYYERNGFLYREFTSPKHNKGEPVCQLVVPKEFRDEIMKIAHESLLGGHLGMQKTLDKVLSQFHWSGVMSDVKRFCTSCDTCQRMTSKGKVSKVPLGEMPLIDTPFKRVAVDLIGPITPVSDRGNRYILTVVDYATRYPEAMALKNIETETVAEALVDIFTRVGVPQEMLSDMGAQFTSGLMKEISRLLSMKQLVTTPYHPQCNGLVERMNGTLKSMIKRMCTERPKDWDKYISPALFAYREAPQASTGFSPFELLYGRTVRGPMQILREMLTQETLSAEVKTVYEYVLDLKERLAETMQFAQEELKKSAGKYKKHFDKKARQRTFSVGERALVLLPTNRNKLLMQWQGPYEIVEKVGESDYRLDVNGHVKTYHANMLKKYVERIGNEAETGQAGLLINIAAAIIEDDKVPSGEKDCLSEYGRFNEEIQCPIIEQSESVEDVKLGENLDAKQCESLQTLLQDFQDVLTDIPGKTNLVEHHIKTTTDDPIRSRPYPVPHAVKETINKEVQEMLRMGVIEPSDSPYRSPVVIVKKPDGTNRFCVDFRKLNQVTVFDAEPMPCQDDIFARLSHCRYFSRIDLSKGYWQIPVSEESKKYTSFATDTGLWQFRRMPFGLACAPAVFSRMMRMLLKDLSGVDNFLDDMFLFTETWEEHLTLIAEVLGRLRNAGLTAKPSKCMLACERLDILGHQVGHGKVEPNPQKVTSIAQAERPRTKTELRSFLGLVGYYRKFIPNFAAVAVPLTDLTKKGKPNTLVWESPHERAFKELKERVTMSPILRMADLGKPFILRTDASNVGLGAVLLQEHEDGKFPVAYASRKLLQRERNYSVVEKECLAVVWGVQKFHTYLYGKKFLLETDHMPLVYLNKAKDSNGRIMRWALVLQAYRFTVVAIKGTENVGADYLSRKSGT
ncbi:hypothetical protein DPMN_059947 [Dreissena polymorpha]|uniref:RNA-directed DNA polymerase n=4 Tax=Dreissena polymorpha TaxID=45954 RepID=A0A9D4HFI4_DREPO|nr:hypothetical protein DPMN_059947 [Dreissena polymorpha]